MRRAILSVLGADLPSQQQRPALGSLCILWRSLRQKNLMKLQMWQSLLESKHRTDKNRSIEYLKRKKNISYLKESNLFMFLKTKWGFLTKQLSKLQNISNFKDSGAAVGLLCSVGVLSLLQGKGLFLWQEPTNPIKPASFPAPFLYLLGSLKPQQQKERAARECQCLLG